MMMYEAVGRSINQTYLLIDPDVMMITSGVGVVANSM